MLEWANAFFEPAEPDVDRPHLLPIWPNKGESIPVNSVPEHETVQSLSRVSTRLWLGLVTKHITFSHVLIVNKNIDMQPLAVFHLHCFDHLFPSSRSPKGFSFTASPEIFQLVLLIQEGSHL